MSRVPTIITTSTLTGALLAGVFAGPAQAAPASPDWTVDGITITGIPALSAKSAATRSDVLDYVATHQTAVTSDAESGELIAVAPVGAATGRISERNTCKSGDAYWAAAATPYTNNCFYGSAGKWTFSSKGTKSYRFRTGNYSARGAWLIDGTTKWGVRQAPGSVNTLTGTAWVKGAQIY
ncbi:hypothetical protein ACL00Q_00500 [Curtobacterium flaccumfaciens pv. flaccumfaciens]|uniref:hypothetical protein n=1 Tax=Curtobacterium flaccumfaciens TaxID=2035 RepID=UPI0039A3CD54